MTRITADTVRQLAAAVGIRPESSQIDDLARGLDATLAAIDRCDELGLAGHELAAVFRLTGGAADAEL